MQYVKFENEYKKKLENAVRKELKNRNISSLDTHIAFIQVFSHLLAVCVEKQGYDAICTMLDNLPDPLKFYYGLCFTLVQVQDEVVESKIKND